MTREDLTKQFLSSRRKDYVLMLPTSYGKTKLALQKTFEWYKRDMKILIVIPRKVLVQNWKEEINKWNYSKIHPNITYSTYISLPKYCSPTQIWDVVIFDEGHHISERCRLALEHANIKHSLILSATLNKEITFYVKNRFHPEIFRVGIKDAIDNDVLPTPKLVLIPLTLDNKNIAFTIKKNIKKGYKGEITTINFIEKWKYRGYKGPLHIKCTQLQYYNDMSKLIEWYKERGMFNTALKNQWLHKAGERLKWLAAQKQSIIKQLIKELRNHRLLTFCPSIEESEHIGCPCINSKVGTDNLELFNSEKIKHIAAVNMVDEGINLSKCKIGIFQMINSSDRLIIQREGRVLRHKSPIFIFPYFKNTREEEIITKDIIQDYNPEYIVTITAENIKNIKEYV